MIAQDIDSSAEIMLAFAFEVCFYSNSMGVKTIRNQEVMKENRDNFTLRIIHVLIGV